ncbi:MAG TPA: YbhB/YbcL family Raf kinase inhibitor-like protein [Acidimicrobiales bacterium]|nr:YbhB/YbcL family Raf kinase inhibitor-like protein [Acidimicrobiales bacterium]
MPTPHRRRCPRRLLAAATSALVVPALLAGCSSEDGRVLPEPRPAQTTTTAAPALGSAPSSQAAEVLTLTSPAFAPGGAIPVRFTCDGDDISPPLAWTSAPPAAELALVVRDPDAGGYVHWIVTSIDPVVQGFGEGGVPEGVVELANSAGTTGWSGPCPPAGSAHTYELTLYALPEPLVVDDPVPAADAVAMLEGSASARAGLTGTYERAG